MALPDEKRTEVFDFVDYLATLSQHRSLRLEATPRLTDPSGIQALRCLAGLHGVLATESGRDRFRPDHHCEDPDFAGSGLKAPSVLRCSWLAVLDGALLIGSIGSISDERLSRVHARLAEWLAADL